MSPDITVTNLELHLPSVLTTSQCWSRVSMGEVFLTGTWPGKDFVPCLKAHVLLVLSLPRRVHNFCGLQKKRNGGIYLNIYKLQVRINI